MAFINKLQDIKDKIENMNNSYQIEILKLLIKEKAIISENNNGTFLNLTELDINIINKLEEYINFVYKQQNQLETIELKKDVIKDKFFSIDNRNKYKLKDNKDVTTVIVNENNY